jgi:hypothetical protein
MTQQEKKRKRPPGSMLEVMMAMLDGDTGDEFLDEINLGTGNYSKSEYWLQVEEFRSGLYAESSMVRALLERAVRETKEGMVDAIYERPDSEELRRVDFPPPREGQTREEYMDEHMDAIWNGLGGEDYSRREHQAYLVEQYAGIQRSWNPPLWRMVKMRHEASQSKDARALDNLFERVREFRGQTPGGDFDD